MHKGYLYGLLAILSWSTIASAFKISLRYWDYPSLTLMASVTASVFLLISLAVGKKVRLLKALKFKDLALAALMGFLNPFLYYLILLKAYTILRAQEAGTLNYIWPIFLSILAVPFLGKKMGLNSFLAILISFAGIVVIASEGRPGAFEFREPGGVLLATGSGFIWAMYWILNLLSKTDATVKLFLNFFFGSIFLLIYAGFTGLTAPSIEGLAGGVYLGLFEMGVPFLLWLMALRLVDNTALLSNLVYLSPFISLLIIRWTLGEKILLSTIAGLTLIVAGIFIQQRSGRLAAHPPGLKQGD
ncbi:MAG: DMT family transporter [Bacteroidales bacterium]|nr:DMT family transporter [Bacteroidales bacterium]